MTAVGDLERPRARGETLVLRIGPSEGRVLDVVAGRPNHVVIDFGATRMLDSSTLAALKRLAGGLRSRGARLSVVCEHPALARLLELTLLSRSFAIFGSVDAALRSP